jgi:hypothetical protein
LIAARDELQRLPVWQHAARLEHCVELHDRLFAVAIRQLVRYQAELGLAIFRSDQQLLAEVPAEVDVDPGRLLPV